MANRALSAPDERVKLRFWAAPSGSVAVTVVASVVFSATITAAVLPPPSLVITGTLVKMLTENSEVSTASRPLVSRVAVAETTWPVGTATLNVGL